MILEMFHVKHFCPIPPQKLYKGAYAGGIEMSGIARKISVLADSILVCSESYAGSRPLGT
jgi:hypothetical protein